MTGSGNADANEPKRIETIAVHAGERTAPPDYVPTVAPIYATSAFAQPSAADAEAVFADERPGFVYTRYGNPTVAALESLVAELEGGEAAVATGSGMAAIHLALLGEVRAGDRIVASRDLYGATFQLLETVFGAFGVRTVYVDTCDLAATERALAEHTPRVLLVETISNPLMRVADIPGLAGLARQYRARLLVDSTFASPVLVNPLRHGAHVVIHSTTKYLSGHGDTTGGIVVSDAMRVWELRELNKLVGSLMDPFSAWLTNRGTKTLSLRLRQQCHNAARVAEWLAGHPAIERVNYPGLADLGAAARQFEGEERGTMLSFDIRGAGEREVHRFMDALSVVVPATTLGDVWSLVLYPAMSSHRAFTAEQRHTLGIGDGLVRLSLGIEHADDLIADLDRALAAATA
ncbi:MAG TPA: PLP-dependent aspartate aminotransferase family protein [Thermomicrobiales bacterium]|jgi:cystathionine gamma-synthase/methionine-gamma-lyase|nr:PLP-dependent aspartate aminotransferase family protein [Thermomicrobiales bacterium]